MMPSLLFYSVSLVSRTTADYTGSGSDSVQHGPSDKTTRIVVGVVVGGVAAIAITAGIIFFFMKKRKWDRIRQCEERLIDYQLTTGYSSKLQSRSVTPEDYLSMVTSSPPAASTVTTYAYDPSAIAAGQGQGHGQGNGTGSRARGMSAPASTTLSNSTATVSPEAPPPAYQSLHQRYDPSRYSQISTRFSSSFDMPRSSTSTFGNGIGNAAAATPMTGGYSVLGVQGYNPSLGVQQQQGLQFPQHQYHPGSQPAANWPSSSSAVPTTTTGTAASSAPNIAPVATRGSRSQSESGERGPRRPRPVLSRLITNL
ncbi:uncharacterized protein ANIA_01716 [Aspergillus nidulans FGSC A4]|uniref:Uncharacterized protein n=1 Tax=Emericella nidulans (strain FGSC A4 / ATCC 38163 / CBS 112.46 / NRRL 194 / M139) TaxID=227321 RepID=C8VNW6_EMENI|nr:hypothetical protein [Aspergillus nidulans FGSC A4]CBF85424.1 TPA: hypothetical protein ANIA_01716 [Aspergillus nidulans FGSC A4]